MGLVGQEDESWALALSVLAGEPWRGDADLIHLWHPPQARQSRRKGSNENWDLFLRYHMARRDPAALRTILKEIHDLDAAESSLLNRS